MSATCGFCGSRENALLRCACGAQHYCNRKRRVIRKDAEFISISEKRLDESCAARFTHECRCYACALEPAAITNERTGNIIGRTVPFTNREPPRGRIVKINRKCFTRTTAKLRLTRH
eukprot:9339656-Pyramimonas_sp.AAC.2